MATVEEIVNDVQGYASGWAGQLDEFVDRLAEVASIRLDVDEILVGHSPVDNVTALLSAITAGLPVRPSTSVNLAVPTFSYSESVYSSELLTADIAKLLSDLEDGGYGIDTADEVLLLDRAQDREVGLANQAIDEVERSFVSRGFGIPPGTMFGALEKVHQSRQDAVSTLSRDIYVKRADQFVQARQFAIQQAGALENTLIGKHANDMLRLLQAARHQLDARIAAVSAQLDEAKLGLEAYAVDGQVYAARAGVAADAAKVAIGAYEANTRSFLGVVEARLKNAEIQLQTALKTADLRGQYAQAGADAIATAISGALNSINGIAVQSSEE